MMDPSPLLWLMSILSESYKEMRKATEKKKIKEIMIENFPNWLAKIIH